MRWCSIPGRYLVPSPYVQVLKSNFPQLTESPEINYETARRRVGFWIEPRRLSANSVRVLLALFDCSFRCTNIHHAISASLNDPSQITVRSCNQKQTPPRLRYAGPLILKHVWLSSRVVSPTSHRNLPSWIFRCPAPSPHFPVVQPPCRACSRFTSSAFTQRLSPSTVKPPSNPGCGNGEQLLRCVWAIFVVACWKQQAVQPELLETLSQWPSLLSGRARSLTGLRVNAILLVRPPQLMPVFIRSGRLRNQEAHHDTDGSFFTRFHQCDEFAQPNTPASAHQFK